LARLCVEDAATQTGFQRAAQAAAESEDQADLLQNEPMHSVSDPIQAAPIHVR